MTSREVYEKLKPLLDRAQFSFDDDRLKISFVLPIRPEDLNSFEEAIFAVVGDDHGIEPVHPIQDKPKKIRTELIKHDGVTIKTDKYDQLYVDGSEVLSDLDQVREIVREEIDSFLKDTTVEGIKEAIEEAARAALVESLAFDPRDFKIEDGQVRLIHHYHFPGPVYPGKEYEDIIKD